MDSECINCGESGNWCQCEKEMRDAICRSFHVKAEHFLGKEGPTGAMGPGPCPVGPPGTTDPTGQEEPNKVTISPKGEPND